MQWTMRGISSAVLKNTTGRSVPARSASKSTAQRRTRRRNPKRCCTASSFPVPIPAMWCSTHSSAVARRVRSRKNCAAIGSAWSGMRITLELRWAGSTLPSPDRLIPTCFSLETSGQRPRVPFGALLERGLLRPGQKLYFGRKGHVAATGLANGQLKWGKVTGSIHEIARAIQNAPCNGWEHWYYLDAEAGERAVIDKLASRRGSRTTANHDSSYHGGTESTETSNVVLCALCAVCGSYTE